MRPSPMGAGRVGSVRAAHDSVFVAPSRPANFYSSLNMSGVPSSGVFGWDRLSVTFTE